MSFAAGWLEGRRYLDEHLAVNVDPAQIAAIPVLADLQRRRGVGD